MAEGHKTAMRQARKKQTSLLNKLCDMVRGNLGSLDRKKVVSTLAVSRRGQRPVTPLAVSRWSTS